MYNSSQCKAPETQRVRILASSLLVFSYFVLPGPVCIAVLTMVLAAVPNVKSHGVAIITIFYYSFLIASRYSGIVWNGSDDLPSYFLAYDTITFDTLDAVCASFLFAKHFDFGFISLTSFINYISGGNRFIYYFSVVFFFFTIYCIFLFRVLGGRFFLFTLILFFLYFKNIHLSMHVLRSSLAVPLILLSLSFISYKRYFLFILGACFQASSSVLAILSLFKKELIDKVSFVKKIFFVSIGNLVFFLVGKAYLFGKISYENFSIGIGNYAITLANVIVWIGIIGKKYKKYLITLMEKGGCMFICVSF